MLLFLKAKLSILELLIIVVQFYEICKIPNNVFPFCKKFDIILILPITLKMILFEQFMYSLNLK